MSEINDLETDDERTQTDWNGPFLLGLTRFFELRVKPALTSDVCRSCSKKSCTLSPRVLSPAIRGLLEAVSVQSVVSVRCPYSKPFQPAANWKQRWRADVELLYSVVLRFGAPFDVRTVLMFTNS